MPLARVPRERHLFFDSDELHAPQIVKMHDAEDATRVVHDDDAGDAAFFHERERFAGEDGGFHRLRIRIHALRDIHAERRATMFFHEAAQVAVGENSGECAVVVDDGRHAEFFCGHFVKSVRHGRLRRNFWKCVAGVHDFVHAEEAFAEAARGMERGEIVVTKIAAVEKGNSERVADGHGDSGAGGGREIERAGFFVDAGVEDDFARLRDGGFRIARECDERDFEALQRVEQRDDFARFAAVGDGEHHVAASDHSEVAVQGFGGMQKKGRRASAGEGGGNFLADDS